MTRPPDTRAIAMLARMARLAGLKRDAELARLARVGQARARILDSLAALDATRSPLDPQERVSEPALVRARLAHQRWTEARIVLLNQQLAQVSADWLRQKPLATRAFGRASVIDSLHDAAKARRSGPG